MPDMDQDEAHVDLTEAELNLLLVLGGGTPRAWPVLVLVRRWCSAAA